MLAVVACLAVLVGYAALTLPDVSAIGRATGTVRILDRHGQLITEVDHRAAHHTAVTIDRVAPVMRQATVAVEDRDFYSEGAVNPGRILRALVADVIAGRAEQGASTITQQLARQAFLDPNDRSPLRKLREALLADQLDRRYSKDEILDMYLNLIYYGHGAYGVEDAAQAYFGKHAADLDLREASLLAGLPQAPSLYADVHAAFQRQHVVLAAMVRAGDVTPVAATAVDPLAGDDVLGGPHAAQQQRNQQAILADLGNGHPGDAGPAPHFAQFVEDQVQARFGDDPAVTNGSITVTTTLDLALQARAQSAVHDGVAAVGGGANNGAMLMLSSGGDILAYVGSADWSNQAIGGQYDLVTAQRRPGSSFKPYVYEQGFRTGALTPDTTLDDTAAESQRLGGVNDFDGSFLGPLPAGRALLLSRNVPTEQAMERTGVGSVIDFAHSLGISSDLQPNLTTAIGASPVRMLDHAAAYAAFANGGHRVSPRAILRVVDAGGRTLDDETGGAPPGPSVMTAQQACTVTGILRGYPQQWGLGFNRPTAGKSGTTDGFVDAWYMSYTPDWVVATWVGHTDAGHPEEIGMQGVYGTDAGRAVTVPFVNGLPSGGTPFACAPWRPAGGDCHGPGKGCGGDRKHGDGGGNGQGGGGGGGGD